MTTKSSAYWRKRFETLEKAQLNKGIDTYHELEKQYTLATRAVEKEVLAWYSRYAKENKITLSEAKKLLAGRDLEAFRMDVKEYIKKGASLDPKWAKQLEQASVRVHVSRLEALKVYMQQQIERLHGHEVDALDKVARDIYTDGYYRTAFEVAKGSGVSATFAALDTNKIDKVISKPWANDGVEFSARIWKKRSTLVNDLHTLLTQNIIKGESPDKLIKLITKKFDVSKHQAARLVMTESAYFSSVAQHDSFKAVGVEQYEIVATLDDRTSDICQEMDGQVFKMSEWEVGVTAPVFHANCRTTTVPYFADLGGERASRDKDGKYKTVPADMTYKKWKESFVVDTVVNAVATKTITPAEKQPEMVDGRYKFSDFEIERETEKAYLLKSDDFTKWIPKSVVNKDGLINKTFSEVIDLELDAHKKLKIIKKDIGEFKRWMPDDSNIERLYFPDGSYAQRFWKFNTSKDGAYGKWGFEGNIAGKWTTPKGGTAAEKLEKIIKHFGGDDD